MNKLRAIFLRLTSRRRQPGRERGQSMVEMALTLPVLLLILAGTVEVGWYYNTYLTIQDATREAARRSANNSIDTTQDADCANTEEFFKQAACLAVQSLDRNTPGMFNPARDDILVSVVIVKQDVVLRRYVDSSFTVGDSWSYCEKVLLPASVPCTRAYSRYPDSVLQARLAQFIGSSTPSIAPGTIPNEAYVLVEIYHVHHQFLGLIPPDLAFLPQEVVMYAYTIMPVPAVASRID